MYISSFVMNVRQYFWENQASELLFERKACVSYHFIFIFIQLMSSCTLLEAIEMASVWVFQKYMNVWVIFNEKATTTTTRTISAKVTTMKDAVDVLCKITPSPKNFSSFICTTSKYFLLFCAKKKKNKCILYERQMNAKRNETKRCVSNFKWKTYAFVIKNKTKQKKKEKKYSYLDRKMLCWEIIRQ